MKPIRVERPVAAPPERVWAIVTDLERSPTVIQGIDRVERLDDGIGFGVGTRWRETRTIFGKEATEVMEIAAVEPGRSYVATANSRGMRYRTEVGVDPADAGGSRIWMSMAGEAEGAVARVMGAVVGPLFRGATRKLLAKDLDDIAAAAETDSR